MLNLESRMEILGITVFRDQDNPKQFFYLPGPPHISQERGSPLFDLFSFRKGGDAGTASAGGFLNMTVDVGIGALKERIQDRLKEQFGDDVTLATVPFSKGTTRVIALGEDSRAIRAEGLAERTAAGAPLLSPGPRFIETILGASMPSMDGDNRAIFSFSLTEDGAAFFMGVLEGNPTARPVGVIYELEYVGLLPAYDLEITINFRSSYQYMRTRFTLGTLFFRADVDNIVEQLKRNESIKIRDTSRTLELSTPEAVQQRVARIDQLVKDLASGALFQPTLTPGEPRVRTDTITAADPSTSVPAEGTTSRPTAMEALRHGPAAAIVAGLGEALLPADRRAGGAGTPGAVDTAGTSTDTSTASDPARPGDSSTPSTTTQPAQATAGDVWNRLGRPQAAFVLRNITQEEERTVTYNLSQITAQKHTISPQSFIQFMANAADLRRRVQVVDLNHPFFKRLNINVTAADIDFAAEGVKQVVVQLRYSKKPDGTYKDNAETILRAATDSKDFVFFVDARQSLEYEYRIVIDYQNDFGIGVDDLHAEGPWTPTGLRSLAVHPRWIGQRVMKVNVGLAPNVPADVATIEVIVRYVNAAHGVDASRRVLLNANHRTEMVPIRLAALVDTFTVSGTIFFTDGTSEPLAPRQLPDPDNGAPDDSVVVSVPPASMLSGDVIMTDPLAELTSVVVDTRVFQGTTLVKQASIELQQAGRFNSFSARLPDRTRPPRLDYRQRRVYKNGGVETDPFVTAASANLVVGIPAESVMTVTVRYLGPPLASIRLSAILMDLRYRAPNGDPEFDQSATLLMTDDDATSRSQEWKIRLPDRAAKTYQWRMTLVFADGQETGTEFQPDDRSLLLVRPPRQ